MRKITFKEFEFIMNRDLLMNMPEDFDISKLASYQIGPCIEIEFCVDSDKEYQESWMGKLIDKETKQYVYWYGLTSDGNQAYDFDSFETFASAKIFNGNCLEQIWNSISLISIDASDVEDRLSFYLQQ